MTKSESATKIFQLISKNTSYDRSQNDTYVFIKFNKTGPSLIRSELWALDYLPPNIVINLHEYETTITLMEQPDKVLTQMLLLLM